MKRIIEHQTYNTGTSTKLAEYTFGGSIENLRYFQEDLYQSRGGGYFLHAQGGALSRYAQPLEDGTAGWGERLIPLSIEGVRHWLEQHDETELIERLFGAAPEALDDGPDEKVFLVRWPITLHRRAVAAAGPRKLNQWLLRTVEEALS